MSSQHVVHCSCGEVIVKSMDQDTKIRAKIIVFKNDDAYAVCKSCDREVKIPVTLNETMLKSMASSSPRLYIKR